MQISFKQSEKVKTLVHVNNVCNIIINDNKTQSHISLSLLAKQQENKHKILVCNKISFEKAS